LPVSDGLGAAALATREPIVIADDVATDERVTNPVLREFRSLMIAPLIAAGATIGVLQVVRRSPMDARTDRLLRIIADRVAVAIEHTRLEGEARELADVVRRIGEGVVVADPQDRVVFANRAFCEMVGASAERLIG